MGILTSEQKKRINNIWESIFYENSKNKTIENQIEDIWQYYDCAGFGIKTEEDFCRLVHI